MPVTDIAFITCFLVYHIDPVVATILVQEFFIAATGKNWSLTHPDFASNPNNLLIK